MFGGEEGTCTVYRNYTFPSVFSGKLKLLEPGQGSHYVIPALLRQRQEDRGSRSAWATYRVQGLPELSSE
jgi:hypothetical protein